MRSDTRGYSIYFFWGSAPDTAKGLRPLEPALLFGFCYALTIYNVMQGTKWGPSPISLKLYRLGMSAWRKQYLSLG